MVKFHFFCVNLSFKHTYVSYKYNTYFLPLFYCMSSSSHSSIKFKTLERIYNISRIVSYDNDFFTFLHRKILISLVKKTKSQRISKKLPLNPITNPSTNPLLRSSMIPKLHQMVFPILLPSNSSKNG